MTNSASLRRELGLFTAALLVVGCLARSPGGVLFAGEGPDAGRLVADRWVESRR